DGLRDGGDVFNVSSAALAAGDLHGDVNQRIGVEVDLRRDAVFGFVRAGELYERAIIRLHLLEPREGVGGGAHEIAVVGNVGDDLGFAFELAHPVFLDRADHLHEVELFV